jgi:hypothetical protein
MSSSALGGAVKAHRRNIGRSVVLIGLGLVLIAVGVVISVARAKAPLTDHQLTLVIYGTTGAGLLLTAVGWFIPHRGWKQGSLGVLREGDPTGPWLYPQIVHATSFLHDGEPVALAWRGLDGRTATVDTRFARFGRFYDRFWADYVAARAPQIRDTLSAGGQHKFLMVPQPKTADAVPFTVGDYGQAQTAPVTLTADTLKVRRLTVALDQVESVDTDEWTERLTFRLLDGKIVGFDYAAVMDLPVLVTVVDQIVAEHAEARRER